MRLIEAATPSARASARRAGRSTSRCASRRSFARLRALGGGGFEPAAAAGAPRLVQRVFGLLGPNGALPIHLTDWARDRARNYGDAAFVRFLDVFHHRMLSLFYRAWAQAQAAVSMDRPRQDFFGQPPRRAVRPGRAALRGRDGVPDTVKLAHAGVFGRQVRSAECLQIVLANYFRVPVRIEEFVGHWLDIAPEQRSRLGRARLSPAWARTRCSARGPGTRKAASAWCIGPLSFRDYERFLPRGRSSRALHDLIRLYVGVEQSWEVRLVLKKEEVPLAWLGNSVWIGWSSWLGARLTDKDAALLEHARPAPAALAEIKRNRKWRTNRRNKGAKGGDKVSEISRAALFGKLNSLGYKAIEAATGVLQAARQPARRDGALAVPDPAEPGQRPPPHPPPVRDRPGAPGGGPDALARLAAAGRDLDLGLLAAHGGGGRAGLRERGARTAHLGGGMRKTTGARNSLHALPRECKKKKGGAAEDVSGLTTRPPEDNPAGREGGRAGGGAAPGEGSGPRAPAQMGKQEALKKFAVDLTERAREGQDRPGARPRRGDPPDRRHPDAPAAEQPDPHRRGRASARPRWSRASRCASCAGDVPPPLKDVSLRTLDLGLLQAGASVKGEFENRLRQVIEEVQASPKPIILFIDEAHTLIGAGGAAGHRRRGQPAQAGARARRAAHDRRHHLGRVQEVLREGPGAHAPLPGRQGRRADETRRSS